MNVFVGAATFAGSSAIPVEANGAPIGAEDASSELRLAVLRLCETHDEMKRTSEALGEAAARRKEWMKKHPAPAGRAYRKWERWDERVSERLGVYVRYHEYDDAKRAFNLARVAVANIEARDQRELVLKCAVAAIYEDGKQEYLRRAMEGCQVISVSATWDTARLLDPTHPRH
ncbi:hypothetical protein IVB45_22990 [Bradyrhizobium sp. 4]|uniref:hypothetical protein n=1 Tax=unclassified Bradyrhizobium TaxID=2631580 RepID=UPI001FFA3A21|nr:MULTISPECIES: hypothetical protein [unclassified Bradyrhizobium]MCK1402765.1 hypothetical protein [Bradyrhizobium sp. 39]MCK1748360.1 hypothetical protein [Bradyrhizobium sp. 135]UPJ32833.1 hypothetical protein IVB45_22990 [Bradyrhizobium sp. 4]